MFDAVHGHASVLLERILYEQSPRQWFLMCILHSYRHDMFNQLNYKQGHASIFQCGYSAVTSKTFNLQSNQLQTRPHQYFPMWILRSDQHDIRFAVKSTANKATPLYSRVHTPHLPARHSFSINSINHKQGHTSIVQGAYSTTTSMTCSIKSTANKATPLYSRVHTPHLPARHSFSINSTNHKQGHASISNVETSGLQA